jgi:transcriptional regulator with PAS, ATPase and Fis domain
MVFSEKYKMPVLQLTADARELLVHYSWPGNVRQLKNITEQINVLEQERMVSADTLRYYLPQEGFGSGSMVLASGNNSETHLSDREILYKVLFDMKGDLNDLKKLVLGMIQSGGQFEANGENAELMHKIFTRDQSTSVPDNAPISTGVIHLPQQGNGSPHIDVEETLSLQDSEKELIVRALKKHKNKRKYAAEELGISERTLYRKIKEYNIAK